MDNKKDNEKDIVRHEEVIASVRSYFQNNPSVIYLFKKTEKLVTALYLLTNHIKDDEPIKRHIREQAVALLSDICELRGVEARPGSSVVARVEGRTVYLIAQIAILFRVRLIGENNSELITDELGNLLNALAIIDTRDPIGPVLSGDFFAVPKEYTREIKVPKETPFVGLGYSPEGIKRQAKGHKRDSVRNDESLSVNTFSSLSEGGRSHSSSHIGHKDAQKERREIILSTVREMSEIGIKDISHRITDCSEKTIQRELLSLVEEGVLKKEGERRWSRYRLVETK